MLFSFALIFLCGLALGRLFAKIHFPPLFGMLLAGIALFGVLLVMLIFGKAIPAIFRGIAWLWRKLFGRGGSAA